MADDRPGNGGLTGIRIIDFGQYIAGPLAAVMLADQGADVIHIDPPGGPRWKRDSDAFLNRSKRRITLDLKQAGDLEIAKRLVATADVLIENFRPGVMDRLGLGWEAVKTLAPQLIYVSLPGFGSDDTRANIPGWEGVIAAATGNAMIRQGQAPEGWDLSKPTYSSIPVGSNFAAFLACTATVSALTARHYTGRGQRIELPLFNAMFEVIGGAGAYRSESGMPPANEMRPRGPLGSGTYQCQDGRWVQFNPIGTSMRFVRWVLDEAGFTEEFAKAGLTEGVRIQTDPEALHQLWDKLEAMFLTKTAPEWEEIGHRAGSPLAFIRKPSEWLATPNARAARQVVRVDDPEFGETWMAGLPVHTLQSSAQEPRARSLPDGDRAEILAELETLKPRHITGADPSLKSPYEKLRVVDLTEILAGPTSGRILAEYGASVVKINSPMRSSGNDGMHLTHNILNRGKRTILLNIETERGQELFWRLVENADVITQNYPRGTADRYGIGYAHVKARRPEIVYVSVSCYGYGGGWDAGRGYETQGQAVSGVMARAGGENYPPEIIGPYNVLDYGTGVMASFAASLGIYHKTVYGEGQQVTAALAQTGTYQGSSYLLDYEGKVWDDPRGPECLGTGALQRFYQAQDGWFFLGAREDQIDALQSIKGLDDISQTAWGSGGTDLESALENAVAGESVGYWVNSLQDAGVGAYEIVTIEDLMEDEQVKRLGLSVTQSIEGTGDVTMPGLTAKLSDTPARLGKPVRRPGGDAHEVLAEIGMGDRADELNDAWILRVPPEVAHA